MASKKNEPSYVARDFSELLWLSTSATLPAPPLQGWIPSSAVCLAKMARKERVNRVEYIWASEAWLCNSFKPIVHLVCFVYWHPAWLLKRRRGHLSKCFGKISTNHKKSKWSATWSICGDVPSKYPSDLFDFQCSAPPHLDRKDLRVASDSRSPRSSSHGRSHDPRTGHERRKDEQSGSEK